MFSPLNLSPRKIADMYNSFMFIGTSAISLYGVIYYRRNGALPGIAHSAGAGGLGAHTSIEDQTKDAFSSAPHHDDMDHGSDDGTRTERGGDQGDDEYALLDGEGHPGQRVNWGPNDPEAQGAHGGHGFGNQELDTSYHPPTYGQAGAHEMNAGGNPYQGDPFRDDVVPSHSTPDLGYTGGNAAPAYFPEGNYHAGGNR
jgi:hypothetical protein